MTNSPEQCPKPGCLLTHAHLHSRAEMAEARAIERARTHIKAVAEELANGIKDVADPTGALFLSGLITGFTSSARILDGETAEQVMERIANEVAAAVGQAYLDGKLPAAPTTVSPSPAEMTVARVRRLTATWRGTTVPLGTSVSRWWDARLIELNNALHGLGRETSEANPDEPTRERLLARVDELLAVIDRLRRLHRPVDHRGRTICGACSDYDPSTGTTDSSPVPYNLCPTIAALHEPPKV